MTIYTPYTYLIGWSAHNKFYYGVRFGKNCNPCDLWVSYFTSSKVVKQFRIDHGEPDIIQIRKTFSNRKDAARWEEKVLIRMNVSKNDKFLNKASIKNHWFVNDGLGCKLSEAHKNKLREAKIGYKPWNAGKKGVQKHSDETRKKMSLSKSKLPKIKKFNQCLCCMEFNAKNKYCSNSCKARHQASIRSSLGINGFQNASNQIKAQNVRKMSPLDYTVELIPQNKIKLLGEPVT